MTGAPASAPMGPLRGALFFGALALPYAFLARAAGVGSAMSFFDLAASVTFWCVMGAAIGALLSGPLRRMPLPWVSAGALWVIAEAGFFVLVWIKPTRWLLAPTLLLLGGAGALWLLLLFVRLRAAVRGGGSDVVAARALVIGWAALAALALWLPRWLKTGPAWSGAPWAALDLVWLAGPVVAAHVLVCAVLCRQRGAAALLLAAALLAPHAVDPRRETRSAGQTGAPDIVWIVSDSIRADHLASFGYPIDTMPFLEALARQSSGARAHVATGQRTESTYSKMLGLDLDGLDRFHRPRATSLTSAADWLPAALLPRQPGLIDALNQRGYQTVLEHAYVDLLDDKGLQPVLQGFSVRNRTRLSGDASLAPYLVRRMLVGRVLDAAPALGRWGIRRRSYIAAHAAERLRAALATEADAPRFVVVHLVGGHEPFYVYPDAPQLTDDALSASRAPAYDQALRNADWQLETIVSEVRRAMKEPLVFVFSDHGVRINGIDALPADLLVPLVVASPIALDASEIDSSLDIVATTIALADGSEPRCSSRLARDLRCPPGGAASRVVTQTGHGKLFIAARIGGRDVAVEVQGDSLRSGAGTGDAACADLLALALEPAALQPGPLDDAVELRARLAAQLSRCRELPATRAD